MEPSDIWWPEHTFVVAGEVAGHVGASQEDGARFAVIAVQIVVEVVLLLPS